MVKTVSQCRQVEVLRRRSFHRDKNGTTAIEPTKYFAFCKHLTPYGVRGSAYCKA